MRIIPAIDIIDGKCVRLTQGDYEQKKIYRENPVDVALEFQSAGLQFLHLVDLDGAKAGKVTNWEVIRSITSQTKLEVDFGGGIKTESEIEQLLALGIQQVNLGSIAIKQPELVKGWIKKFGPEKIILSADVKDEIVQINGWQENSSISLEKIVADFRSSGLKFVTCTDISTDGMLTGPNFPLYKNMMKKFSDVQWIASGGVSGIEDVKSLKKIGVDGVIIGKAIYEGRIKLEELNSI